MKWINDTDINTGESHAHALMRQNLLEAVQEMASDYEAAEDCGIQKFINNQEKLTGETLAHIAVERGNLEALKWLVGQKADLTIEDNNGYTAYTWANRSDGFKNIRDHLWRHDCEAREAWNGESLAHALLRRGHLNIVQEMAMALEGEYLSNFINNREEQTGQTLALVAMQGEKSDALRWLLNPAHGLGAKLDIEDHVGHSALTWANHTRDDDIKLFLRNKGIAIGSEGSHEKHDTLPTDAADASTRKSSAHDLMREGNLEEIKHMVSGLEGKDLSNFINFPEKETNETLAIIAAERRNLRALKWLVEEHNADLTIEDELGYTVEAWAEHYDDNREIKEYLSQMHHRTEPGLKGVESSTRLEASPENVHHKPFFSTAFKNMNITPHTEIKYSRALFAPLVETAEQIQRTKLYLAVKSGVFLEVQKLLDAGGDEINTQVADGFTAFHLALAQGNYRIIKLMLSGDYEIKLNLDLPIENARLCYVLHSFVRIGRIGSESERESFIQILKKMLRRAPTLHCDKSLIKLFNTRVLESAAKRIADSKAGRGLCEKLKTGEHSGRKFRPNLFSKHAFDDDQIGFIFEVERILKKFHAKSDAEEEAQNVFRLTCAAKARYSLFVHKQEKQHQTKAEDSAQPLSKAHDRMVEGTVTGLEEHFNNMTLSSPQ